MNPKLEALKLALENSCVQLAVADAGTPPVAKPAAAAQHPVEKYAKHVQLHEASNGAKILDIRQHPEPGASDADKGKFHQQMADYHNRQYKYHASLGHPGRARAHQEAASHHEALGAMWGGYDR